MSHCWTAGGLPDKAYTPEQEAAAGKIGAAVRGSATRWQAGNRVRPRT